MPCPNCNQGNHPPVTGRMGSAGRRNGRCGCPGGCRCRNRCGAGAQAAADTAAASAIPNAPHAPARPGAAACPNPVSAELYGVRPPASAAYFTCCDPYNGCQELPLAQRNPYWPAFAHPRWLHCSQLYQGAR